MTDTIQTPAMIVRDQLEEVLVYVPLSVCAGMSDRDKCRVLDWCDETKRLALSQEFCALPEVRSVREHMTNDQRQGVWSAFTSWRPIGKQRGLFD